MDIELTSDHYRRSGWWSKLNLCWIYISLSLFSVHILLSISMLCLSVHYVHQVTCLILLHYDCYSWLLCNHLIQLWFAFEKAQKHCLCQKWTFCIKTVLCGLQMKWLDGPLDVVIFGGSLLEGQFLRSIWNHAALVEYYWVLELCIFHKW